MILVSTCILRFSGSLSAFLKDISNLQITLLRKNLKAGKELFFLHTDAECKLLIYRRRVKNAQKPAHYQFVHPGGKRGKTSQIVQSLTGGNHRVMIRDLLVIDISGLFNPLVAAVLQDLRGKDSRRSISLQSSDILMNLLGNGAGKHPGVGSWISHKLFFVELLDNAQGLIRADFKVLGTVILKLCQIIEKRRVLVLLLPLYALHQNLPHRLFLQVGDQRLCIRFFPETVLLVELGRQIKRRSFHGAPFSRKTLILKLEIAQNPVKGSLYKGADLPLPVYNDPQHAGHDPPHGDHRLIPFQVILHRPAVLQGQHSGEVDPHEIVFLGTQVSGTA